MERIDPFFAPIFHQFPEQETEKKRVNKNKSRKVMFSDRLASLESETDDPVGAVSSSEVAEKNLETMLDDVHTLGELIKANPSIDTLRKYKDAVRTFLKFVVDHSYTVEKRSLTKFQVLQLRNGDRPELTIIKVIDAKLERLAAEIVQGQKEQLDILHRVDEIYGLLVDLIR